MKKKKKTKKLLAFAVSSILLVLMFATMVSAAPYSYGDGVPGEEVTFQKYLVMPKETNIPTKEFTFTLSVPDEVVYGDDDDEMPIYPGLSKEDVVVGTASFTGEGTNPDTATGGTVDDGITNSTSKKYVVKDVTVDFRNVKFKEPGVYRYYLTESTEDGCSPVTGTERTIDVNVINNPDPEATNPLKVQSSVMYRGKLTGKQSKTSGQDKVVDPIDVTDGKKCKSYINQYPSQNLYIGKRVEGNQGSKDKYFKFNVTITGLDAGTKIDVDMAHATSERITNDVNPATTGLPDEGYTNPSKLTADANGTISTVFWLQNDEYVDLLGIPTGAHYEVTEDDYEPDGYVSTASSTNAFDIGTGTDKKTFNAATSGDIGDADILTGYKNVKQGVIPTGVILSVAPWVIAGIVIIAGVVFFAIRSRKKYEE